jgi:hypothetical protein
MILIPVMRETVRARAWIPQFPRAERIHNALPESECAVWLPPFDLKPRLKMNARLRQLQSTVDEGTVGPQIGKN